VPLPKLNGTNSTIGFFFCVQPPEVPECWPGMREEASLSR
jgi:hypothetical protein